MEFYIAQETSLAFNDAAEKVKEELKKEGFGVLTEIDVQDTLKKKIGADMKKYRIMGACNPPFAHKALQAVDKIGVLLPCNIIVHEKESGSVEVAAVNPLSSMEAVRNDSLQEIAGEISTRLTRVINSFLQDS